MLEELRVASADPERDFVQHPLLVEPDGTPRSASGSNGRSSTSTFQSDRSAAHLRPSTGRVGAHRDGRRPHLHAVDVDPEAEGSTLVAPRRRCPVGHRGHAPARIESIDLSGLRPDGVPGDEMLQYRRRAELAATGVILHSLPPWFGRAAEILAAPWLRFCERRTVRAPAGPRAAHSPATTRRDQRFGGFVELPQTRSNRVPSAPDSHVVLSSTRPTRLPRVLHALAAQGTRTWRSWSRSTVWTRRSTGSSSGGQRVRLVVFHHDRSTPFGSVLAETARRSTGATSWSRSTTMTSTAHTSSANWCWLDLYSNADIAGRVTEYLYFRAHRSHCAPQVPDGAEPHASTPVAR